MRQVLGGLALVLAVLAAAVLGSYWLALQAIGDSQRAWCPIVHLVAGRPPGPHATAAQHTGYRDLLELGRRYGC
jgi:hypothetical protein